MHPELRRFLDGIDAFNANNGLLGGDFNEEFTESQQLSMGELLALTQDELFAHSFTLSRYADYINDKRARLQAILNWCNDAINRAVAREYNNVSQYAPHDIKVAQVAQENSPVAKTLQWKLTVQARIEPLETKEAIIRRMAENLFERARRR